MTALVESDDLLRGPTMVVDESNCQWVQMIDSRGHRSIDCAVVRGTCQSEEEHARGLWHSLSRLFGKAVHSRRQLVMCFMSLTRCW